VPDQRLAWPGRRHVDGLDGQHLGRTILVNADQGVPYRTPALELPRLYLIAAQGSANVA
jgi:hypothetical protein